MKTFSNMTESFFIFISYHRFVTEMFVGEKRRK